MAAVALASLALETFVVIASRGSGYGLDRQSNGP